MVQCVVWRMVFYRKMITKLHVIRVECDKRYALQTLIKYVQCMMTELMVSVKCDVSLVLVIFFTELE
jgi:hypothetical protein